MILLTGTVTITHLSVERSYGKPELVRVQVLDPHFSAQVQDGKDVLAGLENFPLTYMAMPGYCGWPNGPKSPVAQFDLTYLASEMIRQQRPSDILKPKP